MSHPLSYPLYQPYRRLCFLRRLWFAGSMGPSSLPIFSIRISPESQALQFAFSADPIPTSVAQLAPAFPPMVEEESRVAAQMSVAAIRTARWFWKGTMRCKPKTTMR